MATVLSKVQAIILAGGAGQRFGGEIPKQFVKIAGSTVLEHTLRQFDRCKLIDSIVIVVHQNWTSYVKELLGKSRYGKAITVVAGGSTRQESSWIGIQSCDRDTEKVLLHDAIRPFVSQRILQDTVRALDLYDAVDVAIPCADTIVQVGNEGDVSDIPKRRHLMRGQTPQGFRKSVIEEGYRRYFSESEPMEVTDDCGIIRHYDLAKIHVVCGEERNIKITYPEDIYLADKLFQISSTTLDSTVDMRTHYVRLRGKTGVIFGATRGIGKDIYEKLRENDCTVYGVSRANGCDVRDAESVQRVLSRALEETGRVDYVVNTAGLLKIAALDELSTAEVSQQIEANFTGAVNVTKGSIPYLEKNGGQILLFTSSAYTRGRAGYSLYSASKAAVVNFVQAVSEETFDRNIYINVLNPERTDTPMRRDNFGVEPKDTLLESGSVAETAIRVLNADFTGQVIDVRRERG